MDRIRHVDVALYRVPLPAAVAGARVLANRQPPPSQVSLLAATILTAEGARGFGFSYVLRAGGAALYAHAAELAGELVNEDPRDIGRLWEKLAWQGASVSRTGVSVQAIAAFDVALWDLKARAAGLPLGRLLGASRDAVPCYDTSGGDLDASPDELLAAADRSLRRGLRGIKVKVGRQEPDHAIERIAAVRRHIGPDVALMVDANQQWDYATALRVGQRLDEFGLTWLEEPLNAYDTDAHRRLGARLGTPLASGEMLSSVAEFTDLVDRGGLAWLQPDAPRIGGITPFLKVAAHAERRGLGLAPHCAMEIHVHLACAYPLQTWVEHIDWLAPAFEERLAIAGGCIGLPERPGLGLTLSGEADAWKVASIRA